MAPTQRKNNNQLKNINFVLSEHFLKTQRTTFHTGKYLIIPAQYLANNFPHNYLSGMLPIKFHISGISQLNHWLEYIGRDSYLSGILVPTFLSGLLSLIFQSGQSLFLLWNELEKLPIYLEFEEINDDSSTPH